MRCPRAKRQRRAQRQRTNAKLGRRGGGSGLRFLGRAGVGRREGIAENDEGQRAEDEDYPGLLRLTSAYLARNRRRRPRSRAYAPLVK